MANTYLPPKFQIICGNKVLVSNRTINFAPKFQVGDLVYFKSPFTTFTDIPSGYFFIVDIEFPGTRRIRYIFDRYIWGEGRNWLECEFAEQYLL
jgi:hypothetical protein